ncbi:MAG: hypothetical protein EYC68_12780 [Chloroflexota bacterium]|nr:MAG: hypothetical protein EYC68_12780 [Chloroflexota bacterium]
MRAEYDFSRGERGKHHRAMQSGYTVTIRRADGTTTIKEVKTPKGAVVLAPDVQEFFPDAEAVNTTLRSLIRLVPNKRRVNLKKQKA